MQHSHMLACNEKGQTASPHVAGAHLLLPSGEAEELQVGAQVTELPVLKTLCVGKAARCDQIAGRGGAAHTEHALPHARAARDLPHAWTAAQAPITHQAL